MKEMNANSEVRDFAGVYFDTNLLDRKGRKNRLVTQIPVI